MADSKSLCLIDYGLGTVTVLVIVVAAALVMDVTLIAAEPPALHAAAR